MTDREKIRAEIERRYNDAKNGVEYNQRRMDVGLDSSKDLIAWQHLESAFAQLLSFIDSMPK